MFKTASTGFAVLALETYAVETGLSPFDPAFTHAERVTRGLDFLMDQARRVPIEAQLYGNPDSNGNGRGISFSTIDQQMYENAIVTMAIAAGTEPDRVVESSGSPVVGLTFREVVEDAVDYLAMAQSDAPSTAMGCARGGWTYRPINRGPAQGDNSVTQFVALALAYARHPRYRYQIATRPWVLDELSRFVSCVQHDGGFADGGSGYRGPDENVNAYKTGGLLQELAFLRRPIADLHVVSALTYLQRTWTDAVVGWNQVELADKLAMYSIMNGMESLAIDDLGPIDWYRGFCDELKTEQLADGSWPASGSDWEIIEPTAPVPPGLHSTLWALLVLERAAPPPEVIP